ncbi:diguanylate cyclase [Motilimonas cestriensis]|uniref:diguanylate cyclase n=1 Tax=Motilimonas cestriensis TaxID=2742685 RepID=A0ABS8WD23_9GAMM|nr:diguanylate cyclase [Motilimonas cestriensis]MCE2595656.1 diguanylate cyclase [Motilimonas cestriensis]
MQIRLPVFAVLLILAVAIAPASFVAVMQYKQTYAAVEKAAQNNLALHARLAGEKLINHISMLSTSLSYLAKDKGQSDIQDTQPRVINNTFRQFTNSYRGVHSLYYMDPQGQIITGIGASVADVQRANFLDQFKRLNGSLNHSGFIHYSNSKLVPNAANPYGVALITPLNDSHDKQTGYLLALVSIDSFSQVLRFVIPEFSVAFYLGDKWIGGDYWNSPDEYSFYDFVVSEQPQGYFNPFEIKVVLAEPSERLAQEVEEVLAPLLSAQIAALSIALFITIIFSRLISKTLGRLYTLIRDFQSDSNAPQRHRFIILEFNQVYQLITEMKRTIGHQVIHLKQKNTELINADALREKYLNRVEELNKELEHKVSQRTAELEHTLRLVEEGNTVLERVILYRRALQNAMSNEDVAILTLENLQLTIDKMQFALYLADGRGNGEVMLQSTSANFDLVAMQEEVNQFGDEAWQQGICSLDNGVPVLRLGSRQQPIGWLAANKMPAIEYSQWLLLFGKELSSFLEIRALTQELDYLANTDSLTGLSNRKAFDDDLESYETQLDAEVGLFIIDVNGLKQVNDNKGHQVGDQLLVKVAELLRYCADGITDKCYRLGGDEYAIILTNEQLEQNQLLYQRLLEEQPRVDFAFDVLGGFDQFSCSIGYASTENTAFSMLYNVADQNMYSVKQAHYRHVRQR